MSDNPYEAPRGSDDDGHEPGPPPELPEKCVHCGSDQLFVTRTESAGSGGPDLLPGASGFFYTAGFAVMVCGHCGFTQFFAEEKARQRLLKSHRWHRR